MSEFVLVTTTTGTRHDAERIATELVERRLAGCVQIVGPIRSVYRWLGAVESTEEWLCTAKTARAHLAAIDTLLREIHPYEVPELVATPIVGGSDVYLKWLGEQLG
jgi:periplasmic divalent cation tolerance protein